MYWNDFDICYRCMCLQNFNLFCDHIQNIYENSEPQKSVNRNRNISNKPERFYFCIRRQRFLGTLRCLQQNRRMVNKEILFEIFWVKQIFFL